ncbi:MAG TPA: WD40 repeat domain-containing protein [Trebonia sp.]|nr:WD40 repeat domain-containing protein [Trebonia sp.]
MYVLGAELVEEASRRVLYQVLECPYVGLPFFNSEDAHRFFGRENLINALTTVAHQDKLFVVSGNSGSGKSSVIRAGMLPRLTSENLSIGICELSDQPFMDVVGALARACYDQPLNPRDIEVLSSKLEKEGFPGCIALLRGSGRVSGGVLLVLDQFERIGEAEPEVRDRFLKMLSRLAENPTSDVRIVVAVREDRKHLFTSLEGPLGDRFRSPAIWVGPMSMEDLRAAITGPVSGAAALVEFDEGLVEQICQDLTNNGDLQGAQLPHLQIVLTLLWERQVSRKLTFYAYHQLGGVSRALARYADKCLADMGQEKQEHAGRILSLLVMPGTTDVARRVKVGTFRPDDQAVIEDLVRVRLIIPTEERAPFGEKTVEIAHETLLRSWGQLRTWVIERGEFNFWHGETDSRRDEWIREARDPEHLLIGGRLIRAQQMRQRFPEDTETLADFITASTVAAEEAELQRQRIRERNESVRLAGQSELALSSAPAKLPVALALGICALLKQEVMEANWAVRRALAIAGREHFRLHHRDAVRSISYSPDGALLATAGADGTCFIQNVMSNSLIARIDHPDGLASVVFSPSGDFIATGGADGVARVWEIQSRQLVAELLHDGPVNSVAFSADGRRLATASNDGTARIWKWAENAFPLSLKLDGLVTAVGFAPDYPIIVTISYSDDGSDVRVWDADAGHFLHRWAYERPIRALAFNSQGTQFATAGDDWTARVYAPNAERELLCLKHQDSVATVAFSPDGLHLASANDDGTVRVWNIDQGFETAHLKHWNQVYSVCFSLDGTKLATASEDCTARIWAVGTGEELARLVHEAGVYQAVFGPDGQTIATAADDATARVWRSTAGGESLTLHHGEPVTAIGFIDSKEGNVIATAGGDSGWEDGATRGPYSVQIWNGLNGDSIIEPLVHPRAVADIAIGDDVIATACADGFARLWNLVDGSEMGIVSHGGAVNSVAIDCAGNFLATASNDSSARLWDINAQVEVAVLRHEGWVGSAVFSADGKVLATTNANAAYLWRVCDCLTGSPQPRILQHESAVYDVLFDDSSAWVATVANDLKTRIWDAHSGQMRRLIEHGSRGRFRAAFDASGSLIATVGEDSTIKIWRVDSGEEIAHFVHEPAVRSIAFNRSGNFLASAGEDGTARIWSVPKLEEVSRLIHGSDELVMAFSPDGSRLATAGADGYGRVWALTTGELVSEACGRLTRDLSEREWMRYLPGVPYQSLRKNGPVHP